MGGERGDVAVAVRAIVCNGECTEKRVQKRKMSGLIHAAFPAAFGTQCTKLGFITST